MTQPSVSLLARPITLAAALAVAALYGAVLIATRLDVFSIDVAGHLASGMAMHRGYFHQFNDSAFLGYVHGLFYPPLEDMLLGGLLWLPLEPLTTFKLFLCLLVAGYFTGVATLALRFQRPGPRWLFVAASVVLFYTHKSEGFAQGLCFLDLFRVGITSQFLGAAFFFAVVAELHAPPRPLRLALLMAGVVLSHLIMGLAAGALVLLALPRFLRAPRLLGALALGAGLSAFFWLPFLAYRGLMVRNLVQVEQTGWAVALACVPVAVLGWNRGMRHLAAGVVVLLVPSIFARIFEGAPWLPPLHYYRFDICGIVLVPAVAAAVLESAPESLTRRWVVRGAAIGALATVGILFPLRVGLTLPQRLAREGSFHREAAPGPDALFGRHFVLEYTRSFDFAVENYLSVLDEESRGPKGLFWESNTANHLVSSYLATLVGRPVILDHFLFGDFACPFQQCVLDHFLADFNITRFSVDTRVLSARPQKPGTPLESITSRSACYARTFEQGGTSRFRFVPEPSFAVNGFPFRTVRVEARADVPGGPALNSAVELIPPSELMPFEREDRYFFNPYFLPIGPACTARIHLRQTLVESEDWQRLQDALAGVGSSLELPPEPVTLRKEEKGVYLIELPEGGPRLFKVKLAWFPGMRLVDRRGMEQPLFRGYPHMLGIGEGPLRLEYRRPPVIWLGYAISAASCVLFVVAAWMERRRRHTSPGQSLT
ncbi:hypothetical protein JY651_30610 [Pyxidicoccus parkwayensis]|uniref:Membrane protein 6-pyruvoyl-tetrahydropterin synthase-related domain-containing protein n=1 Tax=Pyxidicoccus parkwayensis TaxID=2813578 RepID=A0ABX7NLB4_9BACT|nr:hypothetical protein [Pyxidicoccus parkwaysis]QSQ19649.1 hypothetical protein JY651_30610 [Pyxidicoccus parkwaysis]